MLAARAGHTDVVNALCEFGSAAVERQDVRGRDAVMFASQGGHDTCLQILLTHAPTVPQSSTYFPAIPITSPRVASTSGLGGTAAQRALLQHADIDGNTALHFASSNGHLLVLRTLLAAGADAEKRNVWSWTAVSYSATVAAEVYFRGLISEVGRKHNVRQEVERKGTGGGVRLVQRDADSDED
jgi:ankyrin repeat protein